MIESIAALNEFINTLNLRKPDGVVTLIAKIHFQDQYKISVFESEVQIITSNELGTVYLIDNIKNDVVLPDMFEAKTHIFSFENKKQLKIESRYKADKYIVSIFPLSL